MQQIRHMALASNRKVRLVRQACAPVHFIPNTNGSSLRRLSQSCLLASTKNQENNQEQSWNPLLTNTSCILGVGLGVACGIALYSLSHEAEAAKAESVSAGSPRLDLPSFPLSEVTRHSSLSEGVWVTYRHGVYDVTDFVAKHPGGDKILMAAGGSVEPFWALYAIHRTPEILAMLEELRIGNLSEEDFVAEDLDKNDPYANDPRRHPALCPRSKKPFNAEPPPELLAAKFITPNELFYVRNHMYVPEVDPATYSLEISGLGVRCTVLTLDDLKRLPKYSVPATVQCAGNRRSEMSRIRQVKGLDWGPAAIATAVWTGVRLMDVLKLAGLKEGVPEGAKHVQFEGLDLDPSGAPYGASVPVERALDPQADILLAYEMNGETLPRDHGFPVRMVVPGVVGARNVKWLSRVEISSVESPSHWQQRDYKGFNPSVDWDTVDFSASPAIQELPVVSAICDPPEGACLSVSKDGTIPVRGYAWSGGGRQVVRVDLTADGGKTWMSAEMEEGEREEERAKPPPRHWTWSLWSAKVPVPAGVKQVEIWAKAVDSSYNTQPESFENIWNLRGVLGNAYHRVKVNISS